MSPTPSLPYMLQPDQLKQLNDHLVDTTGCFAFLKTDQVLFSPHPKSWQDAYTIFGVGLYAVYRDYGCNFLNFFIKTDEFCPNTRLYSERHRQHVKILNRYIRTNLAHGILLPSQRTDLQHNLAEYYLKDSSRNHSIWPDYINQLTEEQWMQITQRLVEDSDKLYTFLWKWGDEWAKYPDRLHELREHFVSHENWFASSFDDRICRPLLHSYGVKHQDVKLYTKSTPIESAPTESSPINRWREQLIQLYRNGTTHPEALYKELSRIIRQEIEPPEKSSIKLGEEWGYGV